MINARNAIHIARSNRVQRGQILWRAKFGEMFSDRTQRGIGTTQPA